MIDIKHKAIYKKGNRVRIPLFIKLLFNQIEAKSKRTLINDSKRRDFYPSRNSDYD